MITSYTYEHRKASAAYLRVVTKTSQAGFIYLLYLQRKRKTKLRGIHSIEKDQSSTDIIEISEEESQRWMTQK